MAKIKKTKNLAPNSSLTNPDIITGITFAIVVRNQKFPKTLPLYPPGVFSCKKVCAGILIPIKDTPKVNIKIIVNPREIIWLTLPTNADRIKNDIAIVIKKNLIILIFLTPFLIILGIIKLPTRAPTPAGTISNAAAKSRLIFINCLAIIGVFTAITATIICIPIKSDKGIKILGLPRINLYPFAIFKKNSAKASSNPLKRIFTFGLIEGNLRTLKKAKNKYREQTIIDDLKPIKFFNKPATANPTIIEPCWVKRNKPFAKDKFLLRLGL